MALRKRARIWNCRRFTTEVYQSRRRDAMDRRLGHGSAPVFSDRESHPMERAERVEEVCAGAGIRTPDTRIMIPLL